MPVREDFLNIRADLAAHRGARGEERIVGGRGAVGVEPQDHPREMGVIGRRSAERVVDERRREERAIRQVLHPAATSLIAEENVELAVRPEADHTAVVVTVLAPVIRARMARNRHVVGLARAELDQIYVASQRRAVPDEAIDTVAEQRHL